MSLSLSSPLGFESMLVSVTLLGSLLEGGNGSRVHDRKDAAAPAGTNRQGPLRLPVSRERRLFPTSKADFQAYAIAFYRIRAPSSTEGLAEVIIFCEGWPAAWRDPR